MGVFAQKFGVLCLKIAKIANFAKIATCYFGGKVDKIMGHSIIIIKNAYIINNIYI